MSRLARYISSVVLLTLCLGSFRPAAQAAPTPPGGPQRSSAALLAQLQAATSGRMRSARHAETGQLRLIEAEPQRSIPRAASVAPSAPPEQAARAFLSSYGALFGLRDQAQELRPMRAEALPDRAFVRFQQQYAGVPVLGGELIVQLDGQRNTLSANGEILPNIKLDTAPRLDEAAATAHALAAIARHYDIVPGALRSSRPELWIYNPALLGGPGMRRDSLTWRLELRGETDTEVIRELVLVDAQTGVVVLHFNQIAGAKDRRVCDGNNEIDFDNNQANDCVVDSQAARLEGQAASGIADADRAYDYSGDTYDYYFNNFGRDSLDGNGLKLISLVNYCAPTDTCPYANAFWDGQQSTYGNGFALADDVVAHELTHGFTEFTSHLFYYYQSGAINESMSDVFGELIDQANGKGTDTAAVRWLIAEDRPGGGAFRDMQDPGAFGDPDRMGSPNYYDAEGDGGGVHSNSGVNNKAAFLMAEGGSFNGQSISGLGGAKVGQIYYRVQTQLLSSGSDYQDLGDALLMACNSLIGQHGISAGNCDQVRKAVLATEMLSPPGGSAAEAPICASGQAVNNLFFDNLENTASGNWVSAMERGTNAWYYPAAQNPHSFDANYATSGEQNLWGYDVGSGPSLYHIRMTNSVALPANAYLHFRHAYSFDRGLGASYDGGVVEYSSNGEAAWKDVAALFTHNGYNATLDNRYGNPLGGRLAFGDISKGYISSRVDLSSLAGQSVRFRFRIGTDNVISDLGWFIDDIRIYTCGGTANNSAPSISATSIVTVTQAIPATITNVATVADAQDAAGTLALAATGAPAGMQVTLQNNAGVVAATVSASCAVAPGTRALGLTVVDSGGLSASAGFDVVVLGNAACAAPPTASFSVASQRVAEGIGQVSLLVHLNRSAAQDVAVPFTIGGTASGGGVDYDLASGALTIASGELSASIDMIIVDDTLDEPDETVIVTIGAPTNAALGTHSVQTITIQDDDTSPALALGPATISVGEGAGTVSLVVRLNMAAEQVVTVQYSTSDGSAQAGSDYAATSGSLSFEPGSTSETIVLSIADDSSSEPSETFIVALFDPEHAVLGTATSTTVTIRDDDIAEIRRELYLPLMRGS